MKNRLLCFTLCFALPLGLIAAESSHEKQKQPILVIPGEVTIDGISRPDLGRSFCDSITGKLLQSGVFTIVDQVSSNNQGTVNKEGSTGGSINPEAIVKQLAGKTTARYALITRMISEDDFSKFSIKKLRVDNSQVVSVYQASAVSSERATMFELLDKATNHLLREVYQEQSRIRRKNRPSIIDIKVPETATNDQKIPPAIAKATTPPDITKPEIKPQDSLPDAEGTKGGDGADKTPKTAQYAGRICAVDAKWQFCVIELEKENLLEVDDLLLVRTDNAEKSISQLNVSRIEGDKVIADFKGNGTPSLRLGLKVYRWGVARKE